MLRPGGLLAALSITLPSDLGPGERALAVELGPAFADGEAPLAELLRRAGFKEVSESDRSEAYAEACAAIVRERGALEAALRAEEGDELFEAEVERKRRQVEAIRSGVLRRVLVTGRRPKA